MAILTPSLIVGQTLYDGSVAFRTKDNASDNFVGGVFTHKAIEFSGTEANEWLGYFMYLNLALSTGILSFLVRNTTGGTLTKGTLVYISGYDTGSSRVLISKADAASPNTLAQLVLTADILNNSNGSAFTSSDVTGIDTSASAAAGSKVFLASGAPGTVVYDTAPTGADVVQQEVGVVTLDSVTGSTKFYPGSRILKKIGSTFLQAASVLGSHLSADAILTIQSFQR